MTLTFTILGCGSSGGVPRPALGWGVCDPNNPKNRRRRCSLLVERTNERGSKTTVLIDTSPDLREQMLDANVNSLDAVLYTHDHADHTHGIDDLRPFFIHRRRRIDVYLDEPTSQSLHSKFGYCFASPPGSDIVTGVAAAPALELPISVALAPASSASASCSSSPCVRSSISTASRPR